MTTSTWRKMPLFHIKYMDQSPSAETIVHSASQEIPRLLWNTKVHYRVHKSPSPIHTLSQVNPIHTPKPYFQKIQFNIILRSTTRSSEWYPPFRILNQNFCLHSLFSHARCMPRSSRRPKFDHPNNWWRVHIMELLTVHFSPTSLHFIPPRSKYCPKHPVL
jgi:hypothetical protein